MSEKQEPVAKVYRHGKSSNGTPWHGVHWFDEGLDMPDGLLLYTHPQPKREAGIDLYSLLACNVEAGVFENQVAPILLDNGFGPQVIKENT